MKFSHISGDRMLDLVNTVEWRLSTSQREEDLSSYPLVVRWCQEAGLVEAGEAEHLAELAEQDESAAEQERLAVVALRENTYAALFEDDAHAAAQLAASFREAIEHAELRVQGSGWAWVVEQLDVRTPRRRLAIGLMELLARDDLDRLHQCEDDACGWVYLDTSPRRNRRWCVTSDCGDRNRSRAYYARQKAKRAP